MRDPAVLRQVKSGGSHGWVLRVVRVEELTSPRRGRRESPQRKSVPRSVVEWRGRRSRRER
jgi:hypothetical protein